jgi:hypothetical protein
MSCFERFCDWLNKRFIPDVPIGSEKSIIRDLLTIGILQDVIKEK